MSLNHYCTTWATGLAVRPDGDPRFNMDEIDKTWVKDGVPIGKRGDEGHPHIGTWIQLLGLSIALCLGSD
jgi:hypothetical protein